MHALSRHLLASGVPHRTSAGSHSTFACVARGASNAGEKAAALLFAASGSKRVADGGGREAGVVPVSDLMTPPAEVEAARLLF